MNKTVALLFSVTAIALTSCKKSLSSRLVGTWVTTRENVTVVQKISGMPDQTSNINGAGGSQIIFKGDGTGVSNLKDANGQTTSSNFNWSANDNSIAITPTNSQTIFYTVLLNEKTKQQWSFDYSQTISGGGISVVQSVKGTYDLSKQ